MSTNLVNREWRVKPPPGAHMLDTTGLVTNVDSNEAQFATSFAVRHVNIY